MHTVIVLNVFQLAARLPGLEGSFKSHTNAFLKDPKSQKKGFLAIFWSLVCWIDLISHIVIVLNVFQRLATLPGHAGSFKNQKNAVLNDPKSQKRGFWPFSWVWSVGST